MISVCMIVKNEEQVLGRCLQSIRGLWDELIIVDTGSRDCTVEIAKKHGATVLHYEWIAPGNKGEARNVGIDAATGDWIVTLDADEVVDRPVELRQALADLDPKFNGANVKFTNYDTSNRPILVWYQLRVFRRGLYRYIHREHEIPRISDGDELLMTFDINFEHRPPSEREPGKVSPMLERLKLDVDEHPGDVHSLYMLARQYGHHAEWNKAIEATEQLLLLSAGYKSDACRLAGIACLQIGNRPGAYEWFHRATAFDPTRRLLWVELAHLYHDDGQYGLALALTRLAAELPLSPYQREIQPVELSAHVYQFIDSCQHQLSHQMAHTHG